MPAQLTRGLPVEEEEKPRKRPESPVLGTEPEVWAQERPTPALPTEELRRFQAEGPTPDELQRAAVSLGETGLELTRRLEQAATEVRPYQVAAQEKGGELTRTETEYIKVAEQRKAEVAGFEAREKLVPPPGLRRTAGAFVSAGLAVGEAIDRPRRELKEHVWEPVTGIPGLADLLEKAGVEPKIAGPLAGLAEAGIPGAAFGVLSDEEKAEAFSYVLDPALVVFFPGKTVQTAKAALRAAPKLAEAVTQMSKSPAFRRRVATLREAAAGRTGEVGAAGKRTAGEAREARTAAEMGMSVEEYKKLKASLPGRAVPPAGKPAPRVDPADVVEPPMGPPPSGPPAPPKEPQFPPGARLTDEAQLALDVQVGVNEDVGRLTRWAGRVPGIRSVINLVNGSALLESEGVGYSAVRRLRRIALWEQEATRFEEQMLIQQKRLFKIDGNGIIKGLDAPWQDVFENPNRFLRKLTPQQRDYIILWHQVKNAHKAVVPAEAWRGRLGKLAEGENFLSDSWVPHYVVETRGIQRGSLVRRQFGVKQASERGRFYEMVAAGVEKGNVYHDSPAGTLGVLLRALGQMTADVEARPLLRALTLRPQELLAGPVSGRAFEAANALKVAKRGLRYAEGAARGEEWVTRIGTKLQAAMPERQAGLLSRVQQALRLGRAARRKELEAAVRDARAALAAAQSEYNAAKSARTKALEALRGGTAEHPLVPREVPGLSGRLTRDREVYEQLVEWYGQRVPGGLDLLAATNAVLLPLRAVGDLSYTALQGLITMFSNPTAGLRSFAVGLEAVFARADLYASVMRNLQQKGITARWIRGAGHLGAADYVVAPATGPWPIRKAAGVVNWTLTPFARAWTRSRNVGALLNFEGRYRLHRIKLGRELTDTELHELVSVIDKMTGVVDPATFGVQATQRAVERSVRFAPSYYRAYLGLLGDAFQGGMRGAEARRALGLFVAGGAASYYAAATALGQEPDFDPGSPNFMTVEIAGQKVGFGGVYYSVMRLFGEIGQAVDEGDWKRLADIRSGRHPLARTLRGGAAPILSIVWDLADRATYIGKPLDSWQAVLKHTFYSLLPFAGQTAFEEGPEQVLPQFFGLRGFPRFPREIAEKALNKDVENWTRLDWATLEAEEPKVYGDLQERTDWAARRGEEWAVVVVEERRISDDFNQRVADLDSEPNPSSRMARYGDLLLWRDGQYHTLEQQHSKVYERRSQKDLNTREQEIVKEGREKLEGLQPGMEPLAKIEILDDYNAWEAKLEGEELDFWDAYRDIDAPPWLKAHRQRSRTIDRRYKWWEFRKDLWVENMPAGVVGRYPTFGHFRRGVQDGLAEGLAEDTVLSSGAVDAEIRALRDDMPGLDKYLRAVGTGKDSETDDIRRMLPNLEALLLANGTYSCAMTDEAMVIASAPPLNVAGLHKCQRAD